jgi:hypothetical protein
MTLKTMPKFGKKVKNERFTVILLIFILFEFYHNFKKVILIYRSVWQLPLSCMIESTQFYLYCHMPLHAALLNE